ncbi:MAG: cytochrome c oxidase assembly protein [Hyphomonas sp.]
MMLVQAPYCGLPPGPADWITSWNLDPVLLAVLAGAAAVGAAYTRPERRVYLAGGIAVLFVCFVSPLCALTSALFSARSFHHLLIVCAAAPLLATTLPARLTCSLGIATALKAIVLGLWHVPAVYTAAWNDPAIYWLLQAALTGTAVMFWQAVRTSAVTSSLAALVGIMAVMGGIGAILTFAGNPLYAPHLTTTWPWHLSPLEDQQLAGLLMWAVSLPVYVLAAAMAGARLVSSVEHEATA